MHYEEWSGSRVAAALAALASAGIPQSRLARMAGVNRSQVNRWSRGENRPGYDPVRRLAVALWREQPALARELVEASGYPWTDPAQAPGPPPIPPDVLAVIRKNYPPERQAEIIRMIEQFSGHDAAREAAEEDPSQSQGDAGTTRAG